jgi:hypothetical protein
VAQPITPGQKISRSNVTQPLITPRQKISWPNVAQPITSGQKISRSNVTQPLITPRQKISRPNVVQPKNKMQKISRPNAVQHQNLVILGQKISWPNKAQPHVKRKTGEKLKARFAKKLEIVCMNINKLGNISEERKLASANPPTTPLGAVTKPTNEMQPEDIPSHRPPHMEDAKTYKLLGTCSRPVLSTPPEKSAVCKPPLPTPRHIPPPKMCKEMERILQNKWDLQTNRMH